MSEIYLNSESNFGREFGLNQRKCLGRFFNWRNWLPITDRSKWQILCVLIV